MCWRPWRTAERRRSGSSRRRGRQLREQLSPASLVDAIRRSLATIDVCRRGRVAGRARPILNELIGARSRRAGAELRKRLLGKGQARWRASWSSWRSEQGSSRRAGGQSSSRGKSGLPLLLTTSRTSGRSWMAWRPRSWWRRPTWTRPRCSRARCARRPRPSRMCVRSPRSKPDTGHARSRQRWRVAPSTSYPPSSERCCRRGSTRSTERSSGNRMGLGS